MLFVNVNVQVSTYVVVLGTRYVCSSKPSRCICFKVKVGEWNGFTTWRVFELVSHQDASVFDVKVGELNGFTAWHIYMLIEICYNVYNMIGLLYSYVDWNLVESMEPSLMYGYEF